jgi:hypothetical protein
MLRDNPDFTLQIIGNAGLEGTNVQNNELAAHRAGEVFNLLVQFGVQPKQLIVRSDGSNNPIYFFRNVAWQEYYNRRTEIRWLEEESKPFEIVTGKATNENDAQKIVEQWEKRGTSAYYERYGSEEDISYRIKLWGYKTKDEATETAKKLGKKYKIKWTVE